MQDKCHDNKIIKQKGDHADNYHNVGWSCISGRDGPLDCHRGDRRGGSRPRSRGPAAPTPRSDDVRSPSSPRCRTLGGGERAVWKLAGRRLHIGRFGDESWR